MAGPRNRGRRLPWRTVVPALLLCAWPAAGRAQLSPLLPDSTLHALAQELSGETAKRNLEFIARQHRMRGSRGFRAAADHIVEQLRAYGLADARVESFPADGRVYYGTQRSRPPWDAEFAELWELRETGGAWVRQTRIASWDAMPITLAQDSESGEAVTELVDVGAGTSERDYAGKEVAGRLVLAAAQPGPVSRLAVERYGAAGIVSYAQNQATAWSGDDESLVRWGHLETFGPRTFAFMVSLEQARAWQRRLAAGEKVRLEARVRAGQHAGSYDLVTATIPGADPALRDEEIVFSCHLDHQRPGANDNASGCVTILEIARTLARLIAEKRIPPPARTLRFVWPPEIEGTLTLLAARPELAARMKAAVHLDMVGGSPHETKAVFHVTRGPASLPSFVYDVAHEFGELANRETADFAGSGASRLQLHSPEGGKEALQAAMVEFTSGSDHQVYTEGSFRIPALYLNDWPDRYIHTNFDTPANIDPSKLKRAAFIGAASGYFLANVSDRDAGALLALWRRRALARGATILQRRAEVSPAEAANLGRFQLEYERAVAASWRPFFEPPAGAAADAERFLRGLGELIGPAGPPPAPEADEGRTVYRRNARLVGPMSVFGYDYLVDRYGPRATGLRIFRHTGLRASGGDYAYEVLNLVDGRRTVQRIRDDVSAIYGPIPLEVVVEFLSALAEIRVIELR